MVALVSPDLIRSSVTNPGTTNPTLRGKRRPSDSHLLSCVDIQHQLDPLEDA